MVKPVVGEAVVLPFPQTNLQPGKRRPALVVADIQNQSSYMTWGEKAPQDQVAKTLRNEFLVSAERADKLSGASGPSSPVRPDVPAGVSCRNEKGSRATPKYPPAQFLPLLYGAKGLVDIVTIDR